MNFSNLLFELNDQYAKITINRPEKLNALDIKTVSELKTAFDLIESEVEIRATIITGAGEKAFVAGADISEIAKLSGDEAKGFSEFGQSVFNAIENSSKPVIAAINGFALGGGCELALACHIRYASVNAKFGQPELNLGIIPGYGGTQRLPRVIGKALAAEYILTGDMIYAQDALRLGLVSKVFDAEELLDQAVKTAKKIASKPAVAVKYALRSIIASDQYKLVDGLAVEATLFAKTTASEDFVEGTSAFLGKRTPKFKNN